jgi:raffinose/stachyose/melibiose transport system substrate-binding protein
MKKVMLFVSVLMLASMVLTACGGGAATQPPAAAGATQAPAAGGQKVTLVYWSMWNPTEPITLSLIDEIKKFEAAYPNITIDVSWNGRQNQTKVSTALAAGTAIDIVDQDADIIAGGLVANGQALPLTDMYNSTALDENAQFSSVFDPGMLNLFQINGVQYLMPYVNDPVVWVYNKDIFNKVGITQPPATWDEFLADAAKIKAGGYNVIVAESDAPDYNTFFYNYLVERIAGPGFMAKALADKTGQSFTDPVFVQAMQMIRDLWDKGYIPAASAGYAYPAGQQTLATGKTAMEMCGAWLPSELSPITGPDFNWGEFPMPTVAGGKGAITDTQEWLLSAMIVKGTAHPAEAELFLKWLMRKDSQTEQAASLQPPTHVGITWGPSIADAGKIASTSTYVMTHIEGGNYMYPELIKNVFYPDEQAGFFGKLTPQAFATKLAADVAAYWANK